MKIYRAETGQQVNWQSNYKKEINSVTDLKVELERFTGVPVQSQILMTSFGTQVKESNLKQVLEAKEQDEYILFCYDRQYLDALPEEISNLLDVETPKLEPKLPAFTGEESLKSIEKLLKRQSVSQNCETFLSLFKSFDDYSQMLIKTSATHVQLARTLVEEQKFQRMALNVAMTNLETHNQSIDMNVKKFVVTAEKERTRQTALVESLPIDLEILKHVHIHPSLLLQKERLIEFVDLKYTETVRQGTIDLCQFLTQETRELLDKTTELERCEQEVLADIANKNQLHLLDSSLADIQEIFERAQFLKDTRKRDMPRVTDKISELLNIPITNLFASLSLHHKETDPHDAKRTISLFRHLAEYQVQNYLPQLANYEAAIRQKVASLAISKRNSIQELIKYMNAVSQIQSEIASVEPRLKIAREKLDDFKKKYGQRDLESVRDILFGYGAWMIEVVRRREYIQLVSENSSVLADLMSRYREEEEKRRGFFRQKVAKMLPFKIPNMDESPPQCEITANIRSSSIQDTSLQKKDITDFISLLGQAYAQSPVTSLRKSIQTTKSLRRLITQQTNEDEKFQSILKVMYQQLDSLKFDFLKFVETDFFGPSGGIDPAKIENALKRDDNESQVLSNDERKAYEVRIQTLERKLQAKNESEPPSILYENSKLTETEDLQSKLNRAQGIYKKEISSLKETIAKMTEEKIQSDHEKEDQRLQIQELEQLLEEERQAYEHNRQSLLNEAKIKDNLADIRIAGLEEDWHGKINDLQKTLEEETKALNELKRQHEAEVNELNLKNVSLERIKNEKQELADQLRQDLDSVNQRLEEEKARYEELQQEMTESERARDEIKSLQQQTRLMVNRAQEDWLMKHEEVQKIKDEQTKVKMAISELLSRYMGEGGHITENTDLEPIIRVFQHNLDQFTAQANLTQENYENLEQETEDLSQKYHELLESHQEWRPIAIAMAEKLEGFRKMVLYDLINQFHISADEDELNILSRKVTPSEDDAAMWNEILQLSSSIDFQDVIRRLNKRVKDIVEQAKHYKKEYKELREKYARLSAKISEKISFRNFKLGDVALFLPTRSSGGKPWAAFNIGSPYYFLSPSGAAGVTPTSSEWIVARIVNIEEHVVDENDPNPYGLSSQVKYYELEVEDWKNQRINRKKTTPGFVDSGLASITSPDSRKRPSFTSLSSSSNIVLSTSPHHDALKRRRSSTSSAMIPQ